MIVEELPGSCKYRFKASDRLAIEIRRWQELRGGWCRPLEETGEITYPFLNSNGTTMLGLNLNHVSKGATGHFNVTHK